MFCSQHLGFVSHLPHPDPWQNPTNRRPDWPWHPGPARLVLQTPPASEIIIRAIEEPSGAIDSEYGQRSGPCLACGCKFLVSPIFFLHLHRDRTEPIQELGQDLFVWLARVALFHLLSLCPCWCVWFDLDAISSLERLFRLVSFPSFSLPSGRCRYPIASRCPFALPSAFGRR